MISLPLVLRCFSSQSDLPASPSVSAEWKIENGALKMKENESDIFKNQFSIIHSETKGETGSRDITLAGFPH